MKAKVTVSIEEELLQDLDSRVEDGEFGSRSAGMEAALEFLALGRLDADFERQLDALVPADEKAEAELGMADYATLVRRDG